MTRDELAVLIGLAANNAATTDGEWCSVKMALAAADTALAALRPKLVWTEWRETPGSLGVAHLMLGEIEMAWMAKMEDRIRWTVRSMFAAHDNTITGDFDETALRAEIERRVLEAMGWGTDDAT